jgi:pimeloyl-ACP methyl ester carboxylesterase
VWAASIVQSAGVKGLITYAALARPLPESFIETRRRNWELEGLSEEEIKQNSERLDLFLKECLVNKRSPADLVKEKPELQELVDQLVQDGDTMGGLNLSYYQHLAQMDPANAWGNVDAATLAIWGECDFTANRTDSEHLVRWVEKGGKSEKAELLVLPGIDHSFYKAEDQEESYLSGFGGEFNPVIVETVVEWINKRSGKSET